MLKQVQHDVAFQGSDHALMRSVNSAAPKFFVMLNLFQHPFRASDRSSDL